MFTQLKPLLNSASLTIHLAANNDGTLSVTILPKSKQTGEDAAALNTPLSITATADELDANFAQVLSDYVNAHQSLAEQLENTTSILDAAKAEAQKKATTAISKASTKPETPKVTKAAATPSDDGEEEPEDGDGESGGGDGEGEVKSDENTQATPAPAPAGGLWD